MHHEIKLTIDGKEETDWECIPGIVLFTVYNEINSQDGLRVFNCGGAGDFRFYSGSVFCGPYISGYYNYKKDIVEYLKVTDLRSKEPKWTFV